MQRLLTRCNSILQILISSTVFHITTRYGSVIIRSSEVCTQAKKFLFFPRDSTQSAIMTKKVVRPCVRLSVCLSVCDTQVGLSHRLKYFEILATFTSD